MGERKSDDTRAREFIREYNMVTVSVWDDLTRMMQEVRDDALDNWDDKPDRWTKEIEDAFPTRSGSHDNYADAMQMVGNRRSKGALVALVNWLLVRLDAKHADLVRVADELRLARGTKTANRGGE